MQTAEELNVDDLAFVIFFYPLLIIPVFGMFRTAFLYVLGREDLVWKGDKTLVYTKMGFWFFPAFFFVKVYVVGIFKLILTGGDFSGEDVTVTAFVVISAAIGCLNANAVIRADEQSS